MSIPKIIKRKYKLFSYTYKHINFQRSVLTLFRLPDQNRITLLRKQTTSSNNYLSSITSVKTSNTNEK